MASTAGSSAESQRTRLLEAVGRAVAEKGYGGATIDDIVRRAGVSKMTFYEHFRDKEDCFIAAYEAASEELFERVLTAQSEPDGWLERTGSGIRAYLAWLAGDPELARAFLIEVAAAGPRAAECRERLRDRYAALMRELQDEARADIPTLPRLPDEIFHAPCRRGGRPRRAADPRVECPRPPRTRADPPAPGGRPTRRAGDGRGVGGAVGRTAHRPEPRRRAPAPRARPGRAAARLLGRARAAARGWVQGVGRRSPAWPWANDLRPLAPTAESPAGRGPAGGGVRRKRPALLSYCDTNPGRDRGSPRRDPNDLRHARAAEPVNPPGRSRSVWAPRGRARCRRPSPTWPGPGRARGVGAQPAPGGADGGGRPRSRGGPVTRSTFAACGEKRSSRRITRGPGSTL